MLECEECGMWRLIYTQKKLSNSQRNALQEILDGMSFSCGSPLQDLDLPSDLINTVFVRQLNCYEPIEPLYYSAKYEPMCILCQASTIYRRKTIPDMHRMYEGQASCTEKID